MRTKTMSYAEAVTILGGSDKSAFRRAVQANHPDQGGSHETMCKVTEAWETIQNATDWEKAGAYARTGTNRTNQGNTGQSRSSQANTGESDYWTTFWAQRDEEARIRREQADRDRAERNRQYAQERAERARQAKAESDARREEARRAAEERTIRVKAAEQEDRAYRDNIAQIRAEYDRAMQTEMNRHEAAKRRIWDI